MLVLFLKVFICENHVSLLMRWGRSLCVSSPAHESSAEHESAGGGFHMRYPLLGRIVSTLEPCLSTRLDRRMIGMFSRSRLQHLFSH